MIEKLLDNTVEEWAVNFPYNKKVTRSGPAGNWWYFLYGMQHNSIN